MRNLLPGETLPYSKANLETLISTYTSVGKEMHKAGEITVMAGLKCPPEVGAQVMMAKAMPMAKACCVVRLSPVRMGTFVSPNRFER
jgi:hypothetical protein